MPNYVRNIVKAKDWEVLKEHLTRLATKEERTREYDSGVCIDEDDTTYRIVDFNKVIPRPKDLDITSGSFEWATPSIYDFANRNKEKLTRQNEEIKPHLDKIYNDEQTQAEFLAEVNKETAVLLSKFISIYGIAYTDKEQIKACINNICKGYYNVRKYGYKNWYDWSLQYWDTKWNAMDSSIDDTAQEIVFETAWSMPLNIFCGLSKYTVLLVAYADEDTGNNYGIIKFEDGGYTKILTDVNKSAGESMACSFDDEEKLDLNYSADNYTDEEIVEYFKTDRETFLTREHKRFKEVSDLYQKQLQLI